MAMSILKALLTCRFPFRPCSVKLLVAIVFVVPNVIVVPAISGHAGEIASLDDQQNDAQPPSQNSDSNKEDSAEKDLLRPISTHLIPGSPIRLSRRMCAGP